MESVTPWNAPVAPGPLRARVEVPGSKSITNRALVLAALADGPSTLRGALRSRDTDLMMAALRALGADIAVEGDPATGTKLYITPGPLRGAHIECGLAGTVMRFVPPVAALAKGRSDFDGDPAARVRPQVTMLGALRDLGVAVEGDALPFAVEGRGHVRGGEVRLDSSASSQFVSGLLLAGSLFDDGLTICHTGTGPVPSAPHIAMTLAMLRDAGLSATSPEAGVWHVAPGRGAGRTWEIEPDLSNATPFLAAAAATGGEISVPRWPLATTQAGDAFRDILSAMGAEATLVPDSAPGMGEVSSEGNRAGTGKGGGPDTAPRTGTLTVRGRELRGIDLDLGDIGELTPTVAALAALAEGPSTLRGIAHLRGHETDRLAALAAELTGVGAQIEELPDGLVIKPGPLRGSAWRAYADHRMATAGAIVGLRVPGITVDDIDSTSKTLPGFARMWSAMVEGR